MGIPEKGDFTAISEKGTSISDIYQTCVYDVLVRTVLGILCTIDVMLAGHTTGSLDGQSKRRAHKQSVSIQERRTLMCMANLQNFSDICTMYTQLTGSIKASSSRIRRIPLKSLCYCEREKGGRVVIKQSLPCSHIIKPEFSSITEGQDTTTPTSNELLPFPFIEIAL